MGSQFAIIYDIIVAAVLVMAIFSSARKGFVSTAVGLAAGVIGFLCAISLCGPLGSQAYDSFVEKPLSEAVDSTLDESMGSITLSGISDMDFDKIKVSGTLVTDIVPEYSGTDKAVFDLASVDFTGTGFDAGELKKFGFDGTEDISSMNGKAAEFSRSDIENHGLGKLITAQVIAVRLMDSSLFGDISDYVSVIGKTVPAVFSTAADSISSGNASAVRSLVLTMIDTSSSVKAAVMDHMIRPLFTVAVQTVIFLLLFAVVSIAIAIVANLLKVVNKIPVVGGMNMFLGGCAGALKGLLSVFVICIAVRFLVSLTEGQVILLNDTVISQTYIFRYFYNMNVLNFLT